MKTQDYDIGLRTAALEGFKKTQMLPVSKAKQRPKCVRSLVSFP